MRFPDFVTSEAAPARVEFRSNRDAQLLPWHTSDGDEYVLVVEGEYVLRIDEGEVVLRPGDEVVVPAGTRQMTGAAAGTRTVHAFAADATAPPATTPSEA